MQPLAQIATLIIQTAASIYLLLVLLRFMLQLARADFYNPISQGIVRATNPLLMPLRRVIPGLMGIDFASLVLGLVLCFAAIEINILIVTGSLYNPAAVLMWAIMSLIKIATHIVVVGLIVTIVASFVAPHSSHPILILIHQLMEPIRRPFSRLLPPMGGLDLSPILIFLCLNIVWILLDYGAAQTRLLPMVVPGFYS